MAVYVYKPHEHTQTTAAAIWTVTHRLKRWTTVTIWDVNGNEIQADVKRIDNNTIKIYFFEKGVAKSMKGRAVIG